MRRFNGLGRERAYCGFLQEGNDDDEVSESAQNCLNAHDRIGLDAVPMKTLIVVVAVVSGASLAAHAQAAGNETPEGKTLQAEFMSNAKTYATVRP